MEFSLQVNVKVTAEHTPGTTTSQHKCTDLFLEISDNLDRSKYQNADGIPTAEGSRSVTQVLIQGIAANIHAAHQSGYRDSAEHFRYIIGELERAFIHVTNISTADWKSLSRTGGSNLHLKRKGESNENRNSTNCRRTARAN